jgi:cytochrome c peroxidase
MRGAHFGETTIFPEIVTRLTAIPEYVSRFTEAFDAAPIDQARIVDAIATYERTLVDHDSSYDRSRSGGPAMSAAAQRGERAFAASGCTHCHNGPMFSDFRLHRLGVPDLPGTPHDSGNGSDQFRTGSLRNISRTGPYMHNGVFNTIDEVFQFYRRVDRRLDPALDNVRPPQGNDAADVKAFFDALSDGTFDRSIPGTVPSGLPVGGSIQ